MNLANWVDPDAHGWLLHPADDAAWDQLTEEYGGHDYAAAPLRRIIEIVRSLGCRAVVVENRYVDADYRSEYAAFWVSRFEDKPAFARRLHFFATELTDQQLYALPDDVEYLGYTVIRPVPLGAVGRTVIAPPPEIRTATLTLVRDEATLFGNRLAVHGAPFSQQDTEYLRCAHAAAWMCHYSAAARGHVGRQVTSAFVEATPAILSYERALPSKGMTLNQLQAVFGALGQPALFYGLGRMPQVTGVDDPLPELDANGEELPPGYWDTRMFSVIARYLNSGYPVLIGTTDHAFVIVGWYRDSNDGEIRFVANDDQRGPYGVITSPFTDTRAPWRSIMVPLPPKVLMSAESAETEAHKSFSVWAVAPNAPEAWRTLGEGVRTNAVSLRVALRETNDYKLELPDRGLADEAVRDLRLARLPRYIWVVEAHDRDARTAGDPCVMAEVVFDATSNDRAPYRCALLLPGAAVTYPPDGGTVTTSLVPILRWTSQLPLRGR
jgi:hypothetical protein